MLSELVSNKLIDRYIYISLQLILRNMCPSPLCTHAIWSDVSLNTFNFINKLQDSKKTKNKKYK